MEGLKFLGDYGKHDELGVINGFRKLSELYIKQLVDEGKWFTVCHKIDSNQVDLMQIVNAEGVKLGTMISETFQEGVYRTSIYKYLLMNFLCYVEVPKVSFRTDTGGYSQTFDKMLITANTGVMASWLGIDEDELADKYKSRVFTINMDDGDDELPYVKLTETAKEGIRKITVPRKNIDVSAKGTRVIPLFMLKAGVDALYDKMKEDVIKVTFLKDNGQVRDIFTTVSSEKIKDIYGQGEYLNECVQSMYEGRFLENKTMFRGYIRVPEIGVSIYDGATRSINYARVVNIDYEEQPDLSFINIDLSTVLEGFQEGVQKYAKQAESIVNTLEMFGIDGGAWKEDATGKKRFLSKDLISLITWSDERKMLLSTVFLRELCLFMLANPQWFGNFTGAPKYHYKPSSGDIGI